MRTPQTINEYLTRFTGQPVNVQPLPASRLKGLPVLLVHGHRFFDWRWLDQLLVLAVLPAADNDDLIDATRLRTRQQALADHFQMPVILVLPSLKAFRRDRLVQLGVPFMVPGTQLFIPPFANLCEQYARQAKAGKLSAAAQATVLYQLLRKPVAPMQLKAWAEKLGYSPMTLTKVRDELVAAELCVPAATVRAHGLQFLYAGRELWEKARPSLRSPVARRIWLKLHALPPDGMVKAGLTALAELTLIEDDPIRTYACRNTAVNGVLGTELVAERREHQEEADACLECWRYDPCPFVDDGGENRQIAGDGTVDRFSLYLSLTDSDDERVRLACDELLEGWTW